MSLVSIKREIKRQIKFLAYVGTGTKNRKGGKGKGKGKGTKRKRHDLACILVLPLRMIVQRFRPPRAPE